ncbi:hypothetical protein WAF17_10765 [Bernardetia sp. ABR2-2B]|uniref:hypothetical protein n=1 Tax=Bernardetia sp. ABR2-2B TaxID=3127472 RepID=UPI0030CFAFF7
MRLFQFLCVMLLFAFGTLINAFAENEAISDQETTKIILVGEPQATADAAIFLASPDHVVIFKKQENSCSDFCPLLSEEHFVPIELNRSDTDFLTTYLSLPFVQHSSTHISVKDRARRNTNVVPIGKNRISPVRTRIS